MVVYAWALYAPDTEKHPQYGIRRFFASLEVCGKGLGLALELPLREYVFGRVDAGVVVGFSGVAKIVSRWELYLLIGKGPKT